MKVSAFKAGTRVRIKATFRTSLGNQYLEGRKGTITDVGKPVLMGDGYYVHVSYDSKRGTDAVWSPIRHLEILRSSPTTKSSGKQRRQTRR